MAYYASASVAEAEELIVVRGPETACTAYASTGAEGMEFIRWDLICDYCGRTLFTTTDNSFTVDLTRYYTEDHPGPFHLLAVYQVSGPSLVTARILPLDFELTPSNDSQPTVPDKMQPRQYTAYGVVRHIPSGGAYQGDEYKSNAFKEYSSWEPFVVTSDNNHRSIYISAIIRPRVGFHFVKFLLRVYHSGSSVVINNMFSLTTQGMSEGSYRLQITRIGNVSSHPPSVDIQIYAIYEYDGVVNLSVKAIPSNYGTIDVVSDQKAIDGSPYVSQKNAKAVVVEKLLTYPGEAGWNSYYPTGLGPSFDFYVTANDGVVAFKRWSDNGARSHRFTITAEGQTLIAYFSEGRLIFDPNNGSRIIYDLTSNSLMYEHLE